MHTFETQHHEDRLQHWNGAWFQLSGKKGPEQQSFFSPDM